MYNLQRPMPYIVIWRRRLKQERNLYNMSEVKILHEKKTGQDRHWKNYIAKDYLGSHNLEKGEEMLLTIAKFEGEEMVQTPEGKEPKLVLYFTENVPKFILNNTNASMLGHLYGNHPSGWIGKKIQVYIARVKAFGKEQDALRIRDYKPEPDVDVAGSLALLNEAINLAELKQIFSSLSVSARNHPKVVARKDELKSTLQ